MLRLGCRRCLHVQRKLKWNLTIRFRSVEQRNRWENGLEIQEVQRIDEPFYESANRLSINMRITAAVGSDLARLRIGEREISRDLFKTQHVASEQVPSLLPAIAKIENIRLRKK